ncbi:hypothetical protein [Arthrobacter sp. JSM 101049]|uniref:hypothetical protein n=1 Tax=Arthrobacter sp. JSM 101049 TaxID=929097 RepID=UPI0035628D0D
MTGERVLQIGMDPDVIDFSAWPDQDADTLRRRIGEAEASLRRAGFEVTACLLHDDADAAESMVAASFAQEAFDVVEIGAGLRTSREYTLVFERVVNLVSRLQPGVQICFNDSPETTLDPVLRGMAR